jgi:sugar phosphate isomerase/epimerase
VKAEGSGLHLTYCTNIHPAETWDEVFAAVRTHVVATKRLASPDAPFAVGLRLSALAARELAAPSALAAFRDFLEQHGLYVVSLNGFPYGAFSGGPIKARVYEPDWLHADRLAYSDQLAQLLAALLPAGLEGSVSTVPGCFRARGSLADLGPAVADRIRTHARYLWELKETTGRSVGLALEPEPSCLLETTDDAVAFCEHLFSAQSVRSFAGLTGLAEPRAEAALREHVGLCVDTCHAAVEFEDPEHVIDQLAAAGIRILKVQASAGLRVVRPDAGALAALERFAEGVYLHQVVVSRGGKLARFVDLPDALAAARTEGLSGEDAEWRVHFHVPVFLETIGAFTNTQSFLQPFLAKLVQTRACDYVEVETYTWDVLPEEHRQGPVVEAIARELRWTRENMDGTSPASPERGRNKGT